MTSKTLHVIYFPGKQTFMGVGGRPYSGQRSDMVPVKRIMSTDIVETPVGTSIRKAARLMKDKEIGSLLIRKEDEVLGIITELDIVRKVVAMGLDPAQVPVERVMSAPLLTIDSEKSVVEASDLMDQNHVRHLGVIEGDQIVGVLSVRDLLRPLYIEEKPASP